MELTAAISVRNLTYVYRDGTRALNSITFDVAPGLCLGLIGPNGAGKSTLLMHLNGLLPEKPPKSPCVWIEGVPLIPETIRQIRQRVGLLFQDPDDQLIWATVYDDVAFGPRQLGITGEKLDAVVKHALATVGLDGFQFRHPYHLSHGEKRKVCLAGILACNPSVLLLDEPTAGLDPRGRRELRRLIASLPGTKIIATHDLELVLDLCPRTILLDHGTIVADGPTAELLANEELMLEHGLEKPHALLHRHPHGDTAPGA